ncbi:30S ribosome-binding factor RbfA [Amaricoccus macauensis]|uniref:30S ribosome-binding factor RbfA n=1 Tax=Amaricoccus macauensis TaxID=57001 RepID=UPI003C79799B
MAKTRHQSAARSGGAPTQRQLRVAELIRRALSDVLARGEVHDPELLGVSITVSEVRCSPDLRHATAFVLPLGGTNTEGVVAALNRCKAEIRHLVTGQIELKYSPQFTFQPDRTFDQMDRTRELLDSPPVRRDLE